MTASKVLMQTARIDHLSAVAQIHYRSLPDDFLPSLGLDFLEKVYYPVALRSEHASTLVALIGDCPVGFVTIAHDSSRFSREILRRKLVSLTYYTLRATLQNPCHLSRSLEVFWSVLASKVDPIKAEIVFIAVDHAYRGQGIGKKLVGAALDCLHRKGIQFCRTKTLSQNAAAMGMYEKLGWRVRDRFRLIGCEYLTIVSPPTY